MFDEQAFRFNNQKHADGETITDSERFDTLVRQIPARDLLARRMHRTRRNVFIAKSYRLALPTLSCDAVTITAMALLFVAFLNKLPG